MKFDLIDTDRTGQRWQIHAHGCKDVAKFKRPFCVEADTPEDVVRRELEMDDGQLRRDGWAERDFRVMPCAKPRK